MIHDAAVPPAIRPSSAVGAERSGVGFTSARWSPSDLEQLMSHLAKVGATACRKLTEENLRTAWNATVEAFADADSAARRELEPALTRLCGLSVAGLRAALEVVLGGVEGPAVEELFETAESAAPGPGPLVAILSSNLPGLAVQTLLPALLLRRPLLLKSPSSEPLFAPAFVRALSARQPLLGEAVAAITWPGGDEVLEAPVLAAAGRILAYGEAATIESLERRCPGRVYAYGPKTSLAVIGAEVPTSSVSGGLARDIALFDQRGCLSIQVVYTDGDAVGLAEALADELAALAVEIPSGPVDPVVAAGVQQIRMEAALRGLHRADLPIEVGTVVVDPHPEFRPSPGLRAVRIHPLRHLRELPELVSSWDGRLQGAALAGEEAWRLRPDLELLGISRCTAPGQLQAADATWHNGGIHPFEALTGRPLSARPGGD